MTKNWKHPHIYYELHGSTATAYVRPTAFFLPFHVETGQSGPTRGEIGNWVMDIMFDGVTERYWGHYMGPDHQAVLTVVPRDYKPSPANKPDTSFLGISPSAHP